MADLGTRVLGFRGLGVWGLGVKLRWVDRFCSGWHQGVVAPIDV